MYRLLVVDDEEKIRVLIRKYAEFEGYEVEEAADGMSAIELCRQNKFDLDHSGRHDAGAGRFFRMQRDPQVLSGSGFDDLGARRGI